MINVTGNVFVTNLKELSPRLIGGTIYTFEKVKDEEKFNTTFVKAKFVGESIVYLINKNVKDKDKVFIKSGILKSNEWTTKEGNVNKVMEITVFELADAEETKYKDTPFEDKKSAEKTAGKTTRFKR